MSHEQTEAVVVPSANDDLPSPFSSSSAVVRQDNGTEWIFYYGFGDIIHYEKKPKTGNGTRHQLNIDGKPAVGSPTELAAALWHDSPRVYYINRTHQLREAALRGTSGDNWITGALSNKGWRTTPNSTLSALGTKELAGESGVFLRIFFNDIGAPSKFTQASNTGVDKWEKAVI